MLKALATCPGCWRDVWRWPTSSQPTDKRRGAISWPHHRWWLLRDQRLLAGCQLRWELRGRGFVQVLFIQSLLTLATKTLWTTEQVQWTKYIGGSGKCYFFSLASKTKQRYQGKNVVIIYINIYNYIYIFFFLPDRKNVSYTKMTSQIHWSMTRYSNKDSLLNFLFRKADSPDDQAMLIVIYMFSKSIPTVLSNNKNGAPVAYVMQGDAQWRVNGSVSETFVKFETVLTLGEDQGHMQIGTDHYYRPLVGLCSQQSSWALLEQVFFYKNSNIHIILFH